MDVAWIQLGQTQKMYQAFSHSLKYMDFISKVRNHDQMGNYTANIRLDEDVLMKTNMFALALCLQKTSSRRLQEFLAIRLQEVLPRCLQDVLKTSSRHLQGVFKTYYQVKVFLVTQFQDIFETYSKRFWDVLLRRLSTGGLPRSHFREIYGHCAKFPRVIKISQVLIFHFTTPFSGYTLQRRI